MLDAMRLTGDAPADAAIKAVFANGQAETARAFQTLTELKNNDQQVPPALPPALRDFLETTAAQPLPRPTRIEAAQNLFVDHGPGNSDHARMLCAARRLCCAQRSQSPPSDGLPRQTPHSTLIQNHADGGRRDGAGRARSSWAGNPYDPESAADATPRFAIRSVMTRSTKWDHPSFGVPINQEDLAGTLLTFSFLAIDGLRKLGANIYQRRR